MKLITKKLIGLFLLLLTVNITAQETINAENPNNFVTGGGQESQNMSITILPVSILDIEGYTGFNSGVNNATLEAGLPVAGGTSDLSNIWLNFTYRAVNNQKAKIYVSTNMPVPNGVSISVEIENNNYGTAGDFEKKEKGKITIGQNEKEIVKKFKNGYTGDGIGNGYRLIYTIDNPNGVSFPQGFEVIYRIGN